MRTARPPHVLAERDRYTKRAHPAAAGDPRPPYLWAAGVTAVIGVLYSITLSPTTAFWDTSEYIATAHILGIPHPPGNPLFVILARSWDILLSPFGLSTAVRINLFSAAMSALAHGFWFLVVHHVLRYFSDNRTLRLVGAAAAVLVSATAFTVWNQSNVNEKVYTVSFFTIALLTWLLFRWQERLGRGKDDNLLVLMVFILALSVGNHLMAFLAAPAVFLFVVLARPRVLLNYRLYLAGAAAAVIGLSVHLFLPIRSELDPIINEGQPTCENVMEAVGSVVTYGNAGCEELSAALNRNQYLKPPLIPRLAPLPAQFQTWLQYFDWQWARGLSGEDVFFGSGRLPFTVLFIALGVLGMVEHYRRDRVSWAYFASLFAVLSVGLVFYMNFKYGFSHPAVDNLDFKEVRERDYFFTIGFSLWGLIAGIGIVSLWQTLSQRLGKLARAAPVLGLALIPLVLNFDRASRREDYTARDWAYNLLMSVEPYGLIFTNGDNDTFPLWYLQEVEGIRRDVTVAVTSYLNTPWYVEQLNGLSRPCEPGQDPDADPTRILCQRPYTAENTNAMYTHDAAEAEAAGKVPLLLPEPVRRPARSIFPPDLNADIIDSVVRSLPKLEQAQSFNLGPVTATIAAGDLWPWQQFTLAAISASIGDRPVYFASSGSAAAALGLQTNVIRNGVAFKLWPGNPAEAPGVTRMPVDAPGVAGSWLNAERSRTLADSVFVHRTGVPDEWEYWPDRSTIGIPNYYAWVYLALFLDAGMQGDTDGQRVLQESWEAWAQLGR